MKSIVPFFVFFLLVSQLTNAQSNLEIARKEFMKNQKEALEKIINMPEDNDPVLLAYQGASKAQMASFVGSPIGKLKYFNSGKKMLDQSLNTSKNVESVYLRLLIQLNAPSFLNYKGDIQNDLAFFKKNIEESDLPKSFKQKMIENLQFGNENNEQLKSLQDIKL